MDEDDYACRVDKHKKAAHAQLNVAVLPRQQRVIDRKNYMGFGRKNRI